MLNQIVLVGRLVEKPEVKELEGGKKVVNVTLAVQRNFKNADGEYETDFIDCELWSGVAENTAEYCEQGDVVGIKGRMQTELYKDKDGNTRKSTKLVAERVTFLSKKSRGLYEEKAIVTNIPETTTKNKKSKDKEVEK